MKQEDTNRRVGRQKQSLEEHFVKSSLKVLTLVYPGTGTQVLPFNQNPEQCKNLSSKDYLYEPSQAFTTSKQGRNFVIRTLFCSHTQTLVRPTYARCFMYALYVIVTLHFNVFPGGSLF